MFNLLLCNAAIIRYSQLKFGHMYLCGTDYKYFSPHCCKCNSFGCIAAIRWGNACHGPHSDSLYSGSEHSQFNSPTLVKREAGFPNPRRALIGSSQLWRVNDSPYYREFEWHFIHVIFNHFLVIDGWGILRNCPNMNVTGLHWWSVNIGSGSGLVPSGNKPLPESMLTQISAAIWCH